MAAVGMALLSCTAPPMQGNGAAISFGIAQFDIGAILGSVLTPAEARRPSSDRRWGFTSSVHEPGTSASSGRAMYGANGQDQSSGV